MLQGLDDIDWNSYGRPELWRDDIPAVLRRLAEGHADLNEVLFAIGNNHAGTYFPVAIPAIPFIVEIVRDGSRDASNTAFWVLLDMLEMFFPEPGFETVMTPTGPRPLDELLFEAVRAQSGILVDRRNAAESPARRAAIDELLGLIEAGPRRTT